MASGHQNLSEALVAARGRSGGVLIAEINLYCQRDCVAREITVRIEEFDDPIGRAHLACPFCGHPLTLNHVVTGAEAKQRHEREARESVNVQRWRRDHPESVGVPLGVLLNDGLPP